MPYLFISLIVVVIDQVTKHLVRTTLGSSEVIGILPFLQIVQVRNEGVAFGLFKGLGNTTFIIISVLAIIIVFYLLIKDRKDRFSFSLILGGAIGNLIDRVIYGNVTDFLDLYIGRFHWPAFNVADSALTLGISFLLFNHLREMMKKV